MQAVAARATARSMAPREHGAYAQLGLPLFAVLLAATPTIASLALMVAAAAAFSAHEPLLVLLGQRGSRVRREQGPRAWSRMGTAIGISVVAAGVTVWLDAPSRPWLAVPFVLAVVALLFTLRQRERTLGGQLWATAALTAVALPAAVASGLGPAQGLGICAVFFATSVVSTLEVRSVVRQGGDAAARLLGWATAVAGLVAIARYAPMVAIAAAPVLAVLLAVAWLRLGPKQLPRIGWALAGSSLVMALMVAFATRAG